MKISVIWRTETPKAAEIAGLVSQKLGFAVMPEYDEQYKRNSLSFECISLSNLAGAAWDMHPSHNGAFVANTIMQYLWDNYQLHGERMIDVWDVGAHACMLERRVRHLEKAVTHTIEDLKRTRSWLKDKRFAEIRRGLEQVLAAPLR